jgi:hypothetical protein
VHVRQYVVVDYEVRFTTNSHYTGDRVDVRGTWRALADLRSASD